MRLSYMRLKNEMINIKGRIREALYEGKTIHVFDEFHLFYRFRLGVQCTSTYYFLSYIGASRLLVYCRPTIPIPVREQILSELRKCIQENGGKLYDI